MALIKLVKSLVRTGRLYSPGTIMEHENGEALIEKGVAVEATQEEAEGLPPAPKKKGKKKATSQAPAA